MTDRGIPVGGVELSHRIGRGGMGEVWAAHERERWTPVAVKIVNEKRVGDPRYLAMFRNEIRLAASLEHRAIVSVLEYGLISEEAERLSERRLVRDTPYLVMEYVDGGSLAARCGRLAWPELQRILLETLDALAHAHARGVIHRDLKPSNVLLAGRRGQLKLTDFGLAHALASDDEDQSHRIAAGTPAYMAPEQHEGRGFDFGPPTDLYALGCLAFELCTGEPPFGRARPTGELKSAHLFEPPPRLQPRMPVPDAFEPWLRRLLMKEPGRRFQRAADAARGLLRMNAVEGGKFADEIGYDAGAEWLPSTLSSSLPPSGPADAHAPTRRAFAEGPPLDTLEDAPPFPTGWMRTDEGRRELEKIPPSLSLYDLRPVPFVARYAERERLWQALRGTYESGRAGAVLLRGAAGYGKSRLAEWLCERAHELGTATILRASFGAAPGPNDGLVPALRRFLRVNGMSKADVLVRLEEILRGGAMPDAAARSLASLLSSCGSVSPGAMMQAEQHIVIRQFLSALCRAHRRAVILWIDDAQWGGGALELVTQLLDHRDRAPCPVLAVLTAREEALVERAVEARLLRGVIEHAGSVEPIDVGPLPASERPLLVEGGLGLHGELAARVEERTAGNPLFAVQLVTDWVRRGVLEPSQGGLRLRAGERADMPDHLHHLWLARVEGFLRSRSEADERALELSAFLGQDVDVGEWRAACAVAGVVPAASLLEDLSGERLARADVDDPGGSWSFAHSMLQECLIRRADEAGRGGACHRACAEGLRARSIARGDERRGRHLLKAGALAEAIEPLTLGLEERFEIGDLRGAEGLADDLDAALASLGLPEGERAWCESWLSRAYLARSRCRFAEGEALARRALDAATARGWEELGVRALWELGLMFSMRGMWEAGDPLLLDAVERSARLSNRLLYFRCVHAVADSLLLRGNAKAVAWYRLVITEARAVGDLRRASSAALLLAWLESAALDGERAVARFEALRQPNPSSLAGGGGGSAEDSEILEHCGILGRAFADTFLGIAYLKVARFADARDVLERSLETFDLHGRFGESAAVLLALAASDAGLGLWDEFDAHVALGHRLVRETGRVMKVVAQLAGAAALFAEKGGQPTRASAARAIAMAQEEALRQTGGTSSTEARLAAYADEATRARTPTTFH